MEDYVKSIGPDVALLILGQPGMGKSSVMAKVAHDIEEQARLNKIPGYSLSFMFHM